LDGCRLLTVTGTFIVKKPDERSTVI
jgi:hypothetical protein